MAYQEPGTFDWELWWSKGNEYDPFTQLDYNLEQQSQSEPDDGGWGVFDEYGEIGTVEYDNNWFFQQNLQNALDEQREQLTYDTPITPTIPSPSGSTPNIDDINSIIDGILQSNQSETSVPSALPDVINYDKPIKLTDIELLAFQTKSKRLWSLRKVTLDDIISIYQSIYDTMYTTLAVREAERIVTNGYEQTYSIRRQAGSSKMEKQPYSSKRHYRGQKQRY